VKKIKKIPAIKNTNPANLFDFSQTFGSDGVSVVLKPTK